MPQVSHKPSFKFLQLAKKQNKTKSSCYSTFLFSGLTRHDIILDRTCVPL